jgi:RimJ/RimL family protein N-acetyltransferase
VQDVRALVESAGATQLLVAGGHIVADKESDEMLGMIALERRDPELHAQDGGNELELTRVLRNSAWDKGYATEAASALLQSAAAELPDQLVLIITQTANRASLRLAERLGFRPAATFEQYDAEQTLATARLGAFRSTST